jgi:hypothetical protein
MSLKRLPQALSVTAAAAGSAALPAALETCCALPAPVAVGCVHAQRPLSRQPALVTQSRPATGWRADCTRAIANCCSEQETPQRPLAICPLRLCHHPFLIASHVKSAHLSAPCQGKSPAPARAGASAAAAPMPPAPRPAAAAAASMAEAAAAAGCSGGARRRWWRCATSWALCCRRLALARRRPARRRPAATARGTCRRRRWVLSRLHASQQSIRCVINHCRVPTAALVLLNRSRRGT